MKPPLIITPAQLNQPSPGTSPKRTSDPRLGELLRNIAKLRAITCSLASIKAEIAALRRPPVDLDDEGLVCGYLFGRAPCKPKYSTAHLQDIHRITSERDLKISQLERRYEVIVGEFETYQQELTDRLTPQRKRPVLPPFEVVGLPPARFDAFTDPL